MRCQLAIYLLLGAPVPPAALSRRFRSARVKAFREPTRFGGRSEQVMKNTLYMFPGPAPQDDLEPSETATAAQEGVRGRFQISRSAARGRVAHDEHRNQPASRLETFEPYRGLDPSNCVWCSVVEVQEELPLKLGARHQRLFFNSASQFLRV
jgi:hypothetical protein